MGNMSGCSQLRRVILCVCAAKLESVNSLQSEKSALRVTDQITMMGRWACLLARGLVSLGNKAPGSLVARFREMRQIMGMLD